MTKGEDTRRFAAEIHKNANRLLSLINDTLELSKLDTLSGEMQTEQVNLHELAKTCAGMLELNAKKRGVTILVEGTEAYRVDKSRSKSTGGTGLGLAIVKHIVAIHDANLELQSEENFGSTITITFRKAGREKI